MNNGLQPSERRAAFYVYLASCVDGTFYVGYTKNVERRIAIHNAGNGGRYTRSRRPITLVASWHFDERVEAMRAERKLKMLSHAQKRKLAEEAGNSQDGSE